MRISMTIYLMQTENIGEIWAQLQEYVKANSRWNESSPSASTRTTPTSASSPSALFWPRRWRTNECKIALDRLLKQRGAIRICNCCLSLRERFILDESITLEEGKDVQR